MSDVIEEKTEHLKKLRAGDLPAKAEKEPTKTADAAGKAEAEGKAPSRSGRILFRAPENKKEKRKGNKDKGEKDEKTNEPETKPGPLMNSTTQEKTADKPAADSAAGEPLAKQNSTQQLADVPEEKSEAETTVEAEKVKLVEEIAPNMKTITVSVPTAALELAKKKDDAKEEEPTKRKTHRGLQMSGRLVALTAACFIFVCVFVSIAAWAGLLGETNYLPTSGTTSMLADPNAQKANAVSVEIPQNDVLIRVSSVEEDLSIQFTDIEGELITGIPFKVNLTDKDGATKLCEDEDMDGEIYVESVASGSYTVELAELPEGFAPPAAVTATVAAKVEYKPVPVTVVNVSEINVEEDDPTLTKPEAGPEVTIPVPQNTVEFVESRTEKKTIKETTVTGYSFKPELSNGYLVKADGTVSDVVAELDADGNLVGGHTVTVTPEAPSAETPAETPTAETTPASAASAQVTSSENESTTTTTPVELFDTADPKDMLKDSSGNYIYKVTKTEIKTETEKEVTVYYGWQTLDGKKYFYDKNGKAVTGTQVILNITYIFGSDGVMQQSTTPVSGRTLGIDVSTWQDNIDWSKVKAAGVEYVMIRCGFRGYGSGKIVEDNMFRTNVAGARAAGLKVGVYFYTAALNAQEAVEEASAVLQIISGCGINYPVAFDCEYIGGGTSRSSAFDNMTRAERTKICVAFCETIRTGGYTPMVYSFKSWLENSMDTSQFSSYKIWVAHVTSASKTSYAGRYDMWQYTFSGKVNGISGGVDMNWSYLGY